MDGKPLDLDPDYERWLRENEPIARPERLVQTAILMVNGTDDAAVPSACAVETAGILRTAYARAGMPERFRFVLVPGAGHNLGSEAGHEVLAWWYRWLLRPSPFGSLPGVSAPGCSGGTP
jgi:alpha-beta hydrolase superfamily lysophospholipase